MNDENFKNTPCSIASVRIGICVFGYCFRRLAADGAEVLFPSHIPNPAMSSRQHATSFSAFPVGRLFRTHCNCLKEYRLGGLPYVSPCLISFPVGPATPHSVISSVTLYKNSEST